MPSKWMFSLLKHAVKMGTPDIVRNIQESVQEQVVKAEATPNPWDDIICWVLQLIVGKPGASQDGDGS